MRPQYHFRRSPQGLCAWSVRRLVELSRDLPRERVLLSAIRKALLENRTEIDAVRFVHDPEPDYIGVHPNDLPYDESSGHRPPSL